jgi:hypothetical protein
MAEYRLLTVWRFDAPLEAVYAAVSEPLRWPEWWPDARGVEQLRAGRADGVGRLFHCVWQGRLPYRLDFDLLATRMEPPTVVEGEVVGDLEGCGRCAFAREGALTVVRHEWRVRTTRPWMNLLEPCVRPLFERNHAIAMRHAGAGLAARIGARLLAVEHGAPDGDAFMAHSLRSSPPAPPTGRTVRW